MIISAVAIDDEAPALGVITKHLEKVPFVHLIGTFTDPNEGLKYIYDKQPDLIFLDINMPGILGTEMAQIMQPLGKAFIFTTAHSEYAVQGYELQALDYLLKPFSFERLLTALNRAFQEIILKKGEETSIFIKDSYDWVRVHLNEIRYIKSEGNLLFIYTKSKTISTRMTISEILSILPNETTMRIHKSYVVNLLEVEKLEKHQVTIAGQTVPMASTYREAVEMRLLRKS